LIQQLLYENQENVQYERFECNFKNDIQRHETNLVPRALPLKVLQGKSPGDEVTRNPVFEICSLARSFPK